MSAEDRQFLEIAKEGIHQRSDGHFEMPLPLKRGVSLPNNKSMLMMRLNHLKNRLSKDDAYKQEYVACLTDVIEKGYVELVPPSELQGQPGMVWYIPHHGVYHLKKKLRVAYDCSAKYHGKALNDWLLQGPDLTNSLVGILCRFREKPVAITCDVEGMFHQVGVNHENRDLLRFLWWENGDTSTEPRGYRMTVHLFSATSSPACTNFALKSTTDMCEGQFGTVTANFVQPNF